MVEDFYEFFVIDVFFLYKLFGIVQFEKELKVNLGDIDVLRWVKEFGFFDKYISCEWEMKELEFYSLRK